MTNVNRLFPLLLIAVASLTRSAQVAPQDPAPPVKAEQQDHDCAPAGTQAEMNQYSAGQYRKTDARLNALYARLLHAFQEENAPAARSKDLERKSGGERRTWVQYRDLHCAAARQETESGSTSPMGVATA